MKRIFRLALLFPAAILVGCAVSPTTSPTSPTPTGNWTNWQIQAGTAITSPPNTYPSFLGAIQIQGTQAAGVFTTINAAGTGTALDYGGAFNSSTEAVTLSTYGYGFGYTQPVTPYTFVPVGVIGGCVYPPGFTGPECLAIFSVPSTGVQIASLTGTYSGTLNDSATPSMSGTATLTLTQPATPDATGAFPLAASVVFPASSQLGSYPLTGTVSGEGITLNSFSTTVSGPNITLAASTNPTATQITVSNLMWAQTGPSYSFTGTLTRQ